MRDVREEVLRYAAMDHLEVCDDAARTPHSYMAIKYSCPICGETFMSEEEAKACRDQKYDTGGLEVGDIVVVPSGYRNGIPEDDPWLAFPRLTSPRPGLPSPDGPSPGGPSPELPSTDGLQTDGHCRACRCIR